MIRTDFLLGGAISLVIAPSLTLNETVYLIGVVKFPPVDPNRGRKP